MTKELNLTYKDTPNGLFTIYAKDGEQIIASSNKNDNFANIPVDFVKNIIRDMMNGSAPQKAYLVQSMMPKCKLELDQINGGQKIYYCKDCGMYGEENEACFFMNASIKEKIDKGYYDIVLDKPTEYDEIRISDMLEEIEDSVAYYGKSVFYDILSEEELTYLVNYALNRIQGLLIAL